MITFIATGLQKFPPGPIIGAIAYASLYLPNGRQEIFLGRILGTTNDISDQAVSKGLNLIYAEEIKTDYPGLLWLKGHLLDLVQKVLAAVCFYLSVQRLPSYIKTSTVGHAVLTSSLPLMVAAMPVAIKIVHMMLDYASLQGVHCQLLVEKAYQYGQLCEACYYSPGAPFSFLRFSTVYMISSMIFKSCTFFSGLSTFSLAQVGSLFYMHLKSSPSRWFLQLFNTLLVWCLYARGKLSMPYNTSLFSNDVFNGIKAIGAWATPGQTALTLPGNLQKIKDDIRTLQDAGLFFSEGRGKIIKTIENQLRQFLQTQVYTPLTQNNYTILEQHEQTLRTVFRKMGETEEFISPRERFLFANMLLCANLHRLAQIKDLTDSQSLAIQDIICWQVEVTTEGYFLSEEDRKDDFYKDLRALFTESLYTTKLQSLPLVVHLNLIAKALGLKELNDDSDTAPDLIVKAQNLLLKAQFHHVHQNIDLSNSHESFDRICELVKSKVS
jgi:hypothetical protein